MNHLSAVNTSCQESVLECGVVPVGYLRFNMVGCKRIRQNNRWTERLV